MFREYFKSISRAELTSGQRLRCYLLLLPWLVKHFRRMGKDLLIAADQILFRLQVPRTKVAMESATSLDAAS
jgi:hypothetical protein